MMIADVISGGKGKILFLCILFLHGLLFGDSYLLEFSDIKGVLGARNVAGWNFTSFDNYNNVLSKNESTFPISAQSKLPRGSYDVWVNCFDIGALPGSREFELSIDGKLMGTAGAHGKNIGGWRWTKLGSYDSDGKEFSAMVKPLRMGYARVHALFFTDNKSMRPDSKSVSGKQNWRIAKRLKVGLNGVRENAVKLEPLSKRAVYTEVKSPKVVSIKSGGFRVSFTQRKDAHGKDVYVRSATFSGADGKVLSKEFPEEMFFVGYESNSPNLSDKYCASWSREAKLAGCGKLYFQTTLAYEYENVFELPIRGVEPIDASSARLVFDMGASAVCSLSDDSGILKMDFDLPVSKRGFYTVGFLGFGEVGKNSVKAVSLPPIYHRRTFMKSPELVCNRVVSQPYAAFQTLENGDDFTFALVANPKNFEPFLWPTKGNSRCGFSLCNGNVDTVQAAYFQPVMGGVDSFKNVGERVESRFYAVGVFGNWTQAAKLVNTKIYSAGNIVRNPDYASLSTAVSNIAGCMADAEAGGWSARFKGRWNIEGVNFVSVSSPLTEISLAILTGDEDYYWKYSLPTIEYTLSRNIFHFILGGKDIRGYAGGQNKMDFPCNSFGADYYLSADALTGGLNPMFGKIAEISASKNRSLEWDNVKWATLLGMYLANPDSVSLDEIKSLCDKWLERAFWKTSNSEKNSQMGFVHVGNYPAWWYLPDLYEITKDKKYLEYAVLGAYHSGVSAWNYPEVRQEEKFTVNKGGKGFGLYYKWWKQDKLYRLGADERDRQIAEGAKFLESSYVGQWALPERRLSGARISRLGLSVEGVSSLTATEYGDMNIMIASWAPEMLRTARFSSDKCLENLSRHGVVGRFSNYTGYYISSFDNTYTNADYPYKGPDTTSIYYHHIPCFIAENIDYLMAQYECASRGEIKFRHLRQKGYVWFVDRIFGLEGSVYGQKARPMISKNAVAVDGVALDAIFARGENCVWALLLNDSTEDVISPLKFDFSAKVFKGVCQKDKCTVYVDGQSKGEISVDKLDSFGFAAGKIVAFKFAAESDKFMKGLKALPENSLAEFKNAHSKLGDIRIMRLRSPFGKDSAFAFATGAPDFKGVLTLQVESGGKTYKAECARYPFEASIIKLPAKGDFGVSVFVKEGNGADVKIADAVLKAE